MKLICLHAFFLLSHYFSSAQNFEYPFLRQKAFAEKQKKFQQSVDKELTIPYQQLKSFSQLHSENGRPVDEAGQWAFIDGSGLPKELDVFDWKKRHSLNDAMVLFKKYISEGAKQPYLDIFQQYEGWLLLTRFNMLADTAILNMENVAFIVSNLIQSKYQGYQLLYHALFFLQKNVTYSPMLQGFYSSVTSYGLLDTSINKAERTYYANMPIDKDPYKEIVRKYMVEKIKNRDAWEKIRKMGQLKR